MNDRHCVLHRIVASTDSCRVLHIRKSACCVSDNAARFVAIREVGLVCQDECEWKKRTQVCWVARSCSGTRQASSCDNSKAPMKFSISRVPAI